mmetsp:Transcript_60603/g.69171  ORF Transcript_60603/g.69171 Transcript_60603/m.69171 type:complete len:90 (-) Transcript_60603:583-852(-)
MSERRSFIPPRGYKNELRNLKTKSEKLEFVLFSRLSQRGNATPRLTPFPLSVPNNESCFGANPLNTTFSPVWTFTNSTSKWSEFAPYPT